MSENFAQLIVMSVAAYFALGLLFAIPFAVRGAGRLDPSAAKGSWGFRLLILPASAAFWPLLASRWIRDTGVPEECNAHREAAGSSTPPVKIASEPESDE